LVHDSKYEKMIHHSNLDLIIMTVSMIIDHVIPVVITTF